MAAEHRSVSLTLEGKKQKLVLDENSFQELLSAAYVLQEHNDSLRANDPRSMTTDSVLLEITEIQSQVGEGGLDITQAAKLIADRLRTITSASGVSVSLITDGFLDCVAESGVPANIGGSSMASHSLVATEKLRNGETFESANAFEDIRLDVDLCRQLDIASLIAAPVHEFGEIAGLVEVRWARANAFQESDVRACQLMAGLTSSVIERRSRNSERDGASRRDRANTTQPDAKTAAGEAGLDDSNNGAERCRVCGRRFGPQEVFCGNCSLPRVAVDPSEELQSKWASLWYMQRAKVKLQHGAESGEALPGLDENGSQVRASGPDSHELRTPAPSSPRQVERRPNPATASATESWLPRKPNPAPAEIPATRSVVSSRQVERRPPQTQVLDSRGAEISGFTRTLRGTTAGELTREAIEGAARLLARYVGPISSTLVKRAAPRADSLRSLYQLLAEHVQESDRARFLKDSVELRPTQAVVRTSAPPQSDAPVATSAARLDPTTATRNSVRIAKPVHKPAISNNRRVGIRRVGLIRRRRVRGFNLQTRDAVLAATAILVAAVILILAGTTSQNSTKSWYERLLVNLGITTAPAQAEPFAGNPETRVWADPYTKLYYCAGSNNYGKTPGGRFMYQPEAQKEQFEPASRTVCK